MIAAAFYSTGRFVWTRNRKLLIVCAALYLALFLCSQTLTLEQMRPYLTPAFAFLRLASWLVPLVLFVGTANAATLDFGGRSGQFPRIFFTLPVRPHQMVLPFIAYGVGTAALLWLLGALISERRILMFGPPGTPISAETFAYWVPCLATSFLVWIQALTWTPFRSSWLRITLFCAALLAHILVGLLHTVSLMTQAEVIAASLLQIPLAFLVATRGVARDRSGVVSNTPAGDPIRAAAPAKPHVLRTFSSATDAQLWFEGRVHRRKAVFVFVLPTFLLLLFIGADAIDLNATHPILFKAIASIDVMMFGWLLVAAAVVIGFSFANYRMQSRWQSKTAFEMPAFFAALPMSTGDFAWVKITTAVTQMLLLSVGALLICAWIAVRSGMINPSAGPMILALRQEHGDFTALIMLLIPVISVVLFLLSATANTMCMTLAGRPWNGINAFNSSRYVLVALATAGASVYWTRHHVPPPGLSNVILLLAIAKIVALALIMFHMGTRGLFSWSRLATIGVFWLATVGSMLTTALWLVPEDRLSLPTVVALLILAAPVLGTAMAPLALQLNRTR